MFVTTSRDPSAKARRFARALASFLSLTYVNRGKQKLEGIGEDDEAAAWLVVIEDHGNPAGLVRHVSGSPSESDERLSFELSGDPEGRRLKRSRPCVVGEGEMARTIAGFFGLAELAENGAAEGRVIRVASGCIDFVDDGETKFRLMV